MNTRVDQPFQQPESQSQSPSIADISDPPSCSQPPTGSVKFRKDAKIAWYRCAVDRQTMRQLTECSDFQGFRQVFLLLGSFLLTGTLAYLAYLHVDGANWYWSLPLLFVALFAHGTLGPFLGGVACHELSHRTPFRTKFWNDFFVKVFSFISWWDYVWFRPSHVRHHQVTVHHDYDGEVVLPQKFSFKDWQFCLNLLAWNPVGTWNLWKVWIQRALGRVEGDWYEFVLPETNANLRREHRNWARLLVFGHAALVVIFLVTGHWFLIVLFTIGTQYCGWLGFLCGSPQHFGLSPNVSDFRLCCRTYTCSWLPGFLYWNMQYHIEHHMFPAVPFYHLPKLREAIVSELPPAPVGLLATWKHILDIHRKQIADPGYCYIPALPNSASGRVATAGLEPEAPLSN